MTAKLITYTEMDEFIAQFSDELHNTSTDKMMDIARCVIYLQNGLASELSKITSALEERQRYLAACLMQIEMNNNTHTEEA